MYSQDSQLSAVQHTTLRIAREIAVFCEEHDILSYLCGGGAIGAVREGGFVPWDDDLDFFMPRADYERFCALWPREASKQFVLERPSANFVNHNNFTTIRDRQSTFIKTYQTDLDIVHGIAVDVFPLDVAPNKPRKQRMQKIWAMVYALFSEQLIPETHGTAIKLGSSALLGLFHSRSARYRVWHFAERRMMAYQNRRTGLVTELCVGPQYMGNIYPEAWFTSATWLKFEDTMLPLPVGYDAYLTKVFGNYHQRPSLAHQKPHHDAVLIDPTKSFEEYRGSYYLKKR